MTTRTKSREHHEQTNAALRLLRLTNKVVGPINANFASAFEFKHYEHKARQLQVQFSDSSRADNEPEAPIDSTFANAQSLFSLAEDFWHVVGWAFNCSCLDSMYAARWTRWHLWLDFIIQVLEADWETRFYNGSSEDSLILQFIESSAAGYGRDRRIMRAIFADGSTKSLNEFKEVFRHELKPPKTDEDKPKKREVEKLDIEAEVYGDYMAPDDDDDSDDNYAQNNNSRSSKTHRTRTPSTRRITPRNSNQSLRSAGDDDHTSPATNRPTNTNLGGPKSIALRLRLLHLLSHVAGCPATVPSFLELPELYALFTDFIRPLPTLTFTHLLTSTSRLFSVHAHSSLCEELLQKMLENNIVTNDRYLTRNKLVESYLPFAASTHSASSNAKVSVLLSSLLRMLKGSGALEYDDEVRQAVRTGVERRERVLRSDSRTKKGAEQEEDVAAKMLQESGRWIMRCVGADDLDATSSQRSDTITVMPRRV